jgi:hypothetical protein
LLAGNLKLKKISNRIEFQSEAQQASSSSPSALMELFSLLLTKTQPQQAAKASTTVLATSPQRATYIASLSLSISLLVSSSRNTIVMDLDLAQLPPVQKSIVYAIGTKDVEGLASLLAPPRLGVVVTDEFLDTMLCTQTGRPSSSTASNFDPEICRLYCSEA